MKYDFIGDIHGHAAKLHALLTRLGYRERQGAWRHSDPQRKVRFVGDFIDRGPDQIGVLKTVRAMLEADTASAVMGNHEFNAIAWATRTRHDPDTHLRVHTDRNRSGHRQFLAEVGEDSAEHRTWIDWFMTLPLWQETDDFRMIHACWSPQAMAALAPHLGPGHTLTEDLLHQAAERGTNAYEAVETLIKGPEMDLPEGYAYTDRGGLTRTRSRVRWWNPAARTCRSAVLLAPDLADQMPETPLPAEICLEYDNQKPLFFGHYWFSQEPRPISEKMCCLDYSAARSGHPLVAYCWDGESVLDASHLVLHKPKSAPRPVRR